jgi:GT2 family glycosyltransferase
VTNVSAVIVYHSRQDELARCLGSLAFQAAQVLVVDVSTDQSGKGLCDRFGVEHIAAPANRGYSWACNLGIASAGGEVIITCNADVEFLEGSVESLAREARNLALCSPVHLTADRRIGLDTVQPGLGRASSAARWLGYGRFRTARRLLRLLESACDREVLDIPFDAGLSGACIAASRGTWAKIGGWREEFFLYYEDADLSGRAHRAGIRLLVVRGALILHESGTRRGGPSKFLLLNSLRSERLVWQMNDVGSIRLLRVLQLCGCLARLMNALLHGESSSASVFLAGAIDSCGLSEGLH